ncbi:hypothetical protein [Sulfurimonas hongkongensis]|nr:hypothetical protein [Sulfurimonas hongkongensis]
MKKIYANNQNMLQEDNKEKEDEDIMAQLQKKLKILEAKLSHAKESEKAAIQAQIGVLLSQMVSLLDT